MKLCSTKQVSSCPAPSAGWVHESIEKMKIIIGWVKWYVEIVAEARQLVPSAGLRLRLLRLWSPTSKCSSSPPAQRCAPPASATCDPPILLGNSWPPVSTPAFQPLAWVTAISSDLHWIFVQTGSVGSLSFAGKSPWCLLVRRPAHFFLACNGRKHFFMTWPMSHGSGWWGQKQDHLCKFKE